MKRRTFIRRSSIGLGAVIVGAGGPGKLLDTDRDRRRIYGIPDSVKQRPQLEQNRVRYSIAQADLPVEVWQDVLALSLLAKDVFDDPKVADAFSRRPKEYLAKVGVDDVVLDRGATEVKVALALGDPEIRAAIESNDPKWFLQAIEKRGLLRNPESSQLAARLSDQIEEVKASLGPSVTPQTCTAVVVCVTLALLSVWVWVAAIQDVVAAVNAAVLVNIYAYALIYTGVGGGGHRRRIAETLYSNSSFRLATALGGPEFGDAVAGTFVDENVEKIAGAVESLQIYQDAKPMPADQLRDLVRTQMLRAFDGHLAAGEPARS